MAKSNYSRLLISVIILLLVGCSGAGVAPPAGRPVPDIPDSQGLIGQDREADSQHNLWGIWLIHFDPLTMCATIEPARNLQAHFNITPMALPPACDDCVEIDVNSFEPVTRIMDVDVTLRNRYSVTGYDVRGILYTNDAGHLLTNALGWTKLWDVPGGQSLNPFKGFYVGPDPAAFAPDEERAENYLVYIPQPPQYHLIAFAIDASWPGKCKEPYGMSLFSHEPFYDAVGAKTEARISVFDWQDDVDKVSMVATEITGQSFTPFYYGAGPVWLVDLVNSTGAAAGDYEVRIIATSAGSGDVALYQYVTITITEAPGPLVYGIDPDSGGAGADLVDVTISGANFAGPGASVRLLKNPGPEFPAANVVVVDSNTITCELSIPFATGGDTLGIYDVEVTNGDASVGMGEDLFEVLCPTPAIGALAPSKSGAGADLVDVEIYGANFGDGPELAVNLKKDGQPDIVATDIVVVGPGEMNCDLSIPPGAELGPYDVEVTNGCGGVGAGAGSFEVRADGWVETGWSSQGDKGRGVAMDSERCIIVTGLYQNYRAFLAKYDEYGNRLWILKWGSGSNQAQGWDVACAGEKDNIYVAGIFTGTVDFDPDPTAEDEHTTNGNWDMFLSCFGSDGAHKWTVTWGGTSSDQVRGLAADSKGAYVTGAFREAVDFNPGSGVDTHNTAGETDAFLTRLDSFGEYGWAVTWGGAGVDFAYDVCGLGSYVYVAGSFADEVDFDPDPIGKAIRTSHGIDDAYLSKYDSTGDFEWVAAWGGSNKDSAYGVAATGDYVYVTGEFKDSVIFDPESSDPGDAIASAGGYDIHLSRFSSKGSFGWVLTWGDVDDDHGYDVGINKFNDTLLLAGDFMGTVDFDPGLPIDAHVANGGTDAFILSLGYDGSYVWGRSWGDGEDDEAEATVAGPEGVSYTTGYFQGSVEFDPGPGEYYRDSMGELDFYLLKLSVDGAWY